MITDAIESMLTQHQRLFIFASPLPPEQELQLLSFSGREAVVLHVADADIQLSNIEFGGV